MEDAIRQPDLSKSVQRYQLAVDEAKIRLDFVACPGTWLMPSQMVISTASTVGYNNQLKQATTNMKLGVNNNVNSETKKVGLRLMDAAGLRRLTYQIAPIQPNSQRGNESTGYGRAKKKRHPKNKPILSLNKPILHLTRKLEPPSTIQIK